MRTKGIASTIASMWDGGQSLRRADGRPADEIRPIEAEVDLLPVPHGSAFFRRGSTSAICAVSLGPTRLLKVWSVTGCSLAHGHRSSARSY